MFVASMGEGEYWMKYERKKKKMKTSVREKKRKDNVEIKGEGGVDFNDVVKDY